MQRSLSVILIGHRGVGKTSLGKAAAKHLGWEFVDVDQALSTAYQRSIDDYFLRGDVALFREREIAQLTKSLTTRRPTIIAAGGGLAVSPRFLEVIAAHPPICVVWLVRQVSTAQLSNRPRLHPNLSLENEQLKLANERDPSYQQAAHDRFEIDSDLGEDRSGFELAYRIASISAFIRSSFFKQMTHTCQTSGDLHRAMALGLHIEYRTDQAHDFSLTDLPAGSLVSLRTDSAIDLHGRTDLSLDIDTIFRHHQPPEGVTWFISTHDSTEIVPDVDKVAIPIDSCRQLIEIRERLPDQAMLYPIGDRWRWYRLTMLSEMPAHLPAFVALPGAQSAAGQPTLLDYARCYLCKDPPLLRFGLIGQATDCSYGLDFHPQILLNGIYVGIPVPPEEFWDACQLLKTLSFRGLSVTNPHKASAGKMVGARTPLNTLAHYPYGWVGTDTDVQGAATILDQLVDPVLVIGRGAMGRLLVSLLEKAARPPPHIAPSDSIDSATLQRVNTIVNASGRDLLPAVLNHLERHPDVLLTELRYNQSNCRHPRFIDGTSWFFAQAAGQINYWGLGMSELIAFPCPRLTSRNAFLKVAIDRMRD